MLQAFIITLREGLEAFLIVGISLAYLKKTGRPELASAVRWGIAVSVAISIGAGMLLSQARNQALWEAMLAMTAAVLVGSLIVYMWRTARKMRRHIEGRLEESAARTGAAAFLGVLAFTIVMITREGMETALLMSTLLFQVRAPDVIAGAAGGTLVAAGVAWLWSRFGYRVNLARFFQVTALFLGVFIIQLAIYAFHELMEANIGIPNSAMLHDLTEPYGPDGRYGQMLTYLLIALPLGWLIIANFFRPQTPNRRAA